MGGPSPLIAATARTALSMPFSGVTRLRVHSR